MKIEKPNEADVNTLTEGADIKVNGRKYTVTKHYGSFTSLVGTRGGNATLVPSRSGKRVQLTTVRGTRDWIFSLEV